MKTTLKRAKVLLVVGFIAAALVDSVLVRGAVAKTQLRVAYSSISGSAIVPFIALDKGCLPNTTSTSN